MEGSEIEGKKWIQIKKRKKSVFKQTQSALGLGTKQRKMLPGQRLLPNRLNFSPPRFPVFPPSLCCAAAMRYEILSGAPCGFRSRCDCDRQLSGQTSGIGRAILGSDLLKTQ